jgi:hypothetical protein
MHELPKPVRIALLVLLVADLALIVYMAFASGLARTPIQALPPLYWVLLVMFPVLLLFGTLMPGSKTSETNRRSTFGDTKSDILSQLVLAIFATFSGCVFLLFGFASILNLPESGGTAALMLAVGCAAFIRAFVFYQRYQSLRKIH